MRHTRIVLLALLGVCGTASAYVIGGSNLGFSGYPDPTCYKPSRPYDLSNEYAVDSYNRGIREYRECLETYLDNAQNDINRIKEKMRETVDNA